MRNIHTQKDNAAELSCRRSISFPTLRKRPSLPSGELSVVTVADGNAELITTSIPSSNLPRVKQEEQTAGSSESCASATSLKNQGCTWIRRNRCMWEKEISSTGRSTGTANLPFHTSPHLLGSASYQSAGESHRLTPMPASGTTRLRQRADECNRGEIVWVSLTTIPQDERNTPLRAIPSLLPQQHTQKLDVEESKKRFPTATEGQEQELHHADDIRKQDSDNSIMDHASLATPDARKRQLPFGNSFECTFDTAVARSSSSSYRSTVFSNPLSRPITSSADLLRRANSTKLFPKTHSCFSLTRECSFLLQKSNSEHCTEASHMVEHSVLLLYITAWRDPHIHYRKPDGSWTAVPGERLEPVPEPLSDQPQAAWSLLPPYLKAAARSNPAKLWMACISQSSVEFLLNDGRLSCWDKGPGGKHYWIGTEGRYLLHNGMVHTLLDPPQKPALLRSVEVGNSHATIAWNPPAMLTENVAGYKVYRNDRMIATVDPGTRVYSDTDLMGLTTYRFHVKAFNYLEQEGAASEKIAVRTGEPGKPSAPCELACTGHGQKSIQITWKAPADHGGAPIRYYRIYKNGHHLAFVSALAGTIPSFVDDTVTPTELCTYRVSAWHNLPPAGCDETRIPMKPSADPFDWFKASVGRSPIEGLLSEPLGVKADDMLQMPRLNDAKPHILLQGFNWVSSRNPYGWYRVVKNKLPDIKRLGASIIWLPPPTESVAAEGYMPTRWYNLNSKYGSQEDLKTLIRTAADDYNLSCCVDVVVNHRSATKQDKRGHWTVFEDPHWGPWAIVCNNLQGYKGEGGFDTGTRVDCAPDLDHTNKRVQEDVKKWLSWLVREIGYTSIRLDMAGGYGVAFQKSYIDSVDRPFTVGEYWDGCTETLANYVRAGQGSLAAFDFALYYVLKRCVESQHFHELNSCGRINGLIGLEPQLAVTFIENHDTDHLDYCTTFGGGNLDAVLQGYAFLLTHPGVPSVYWNHFSDYGPYCKEKLQELCDVRVGQGIHSTSGIFMSRTEEGLYAAYISSQSCYCRPDTANVAMKIGFKDWVPEGHRWKIATFGKNYCVWTR